MMMMFVIL